jgi:flavoprotein
VCGCYNNFVQLFDGAEQARLPSAPAAFSRTYLMATPNDQKTNVKEPFQITRAKCGQCGRELRYVPFALNNIMCRECYGLDRYRRNAPVTSIVPEKPIEVSITDEEATTNTA